MFILRCHPFSWKIFNTKFYRYFSGVQMKQYSKRKTCSGHTISAPLHTLGQHFWALFYTWFSMNPMYLELRTYSPFGCPSRVTRSEEWTTNAQESNTNTELFDGPCKSTPTWQNALSVGPDVDHLYTSPAQRSPCSPEEHGSRRSKVGADALCRSLCLTRPQIRESRAQALTMLI